MKISSDNFIGGKWEKGKAGSRAVISPWDGKEIGSFSVPDAEQIERAIKAASAAQTDWGRAPAKERARVLFRFREILLREADAIAQLKGAECGKIFAEAKAGLMKGVEVTEFALSIQNLDLGVKWKFREG